MASGRVTLTALSIVLPYVTPEKHRLLLRKACRRSTRELQTFVAGLAPEAPRRDVVRVVSAPPARPATQAPTQEPAAPSPTASSLAFPADSLFPGAARSRFEQRPAGEVRYRLSFDCSAELEAKLQRAKELLSNKYPSMRLEHVLADATLALLDKIDYERRHARRILRLRRQAQGGFPTAGSA